MAIGHGQERRQNPRVHTPLLVIARFEGMDGVHSDYLEDISESGMFLRGKLDVAAGREVDLQFSSRDGRIWAEIQAEVLRSDLGSPAPGVAVRFKPLAAPLREQLARVIEESKELSIETEDLMMLGP